MVKALIFLTLTLSGCLVFAGSSKSCVQLFIKGSEADVSAELQRALNLGKELMPMNDSQRASLLTKLYPDGFLIHGTATTVVDLAIKSQGRFFGSKSISSQYWSESPELPYSGLRKKLDDYRTLYFYDSKFEASLQIPFRDSAVYASLSAKGFQVLKELGLDVERFAELTQIMASIINGDWNNLEDIHYSGEEYFSSSQIEKVGEILASIGDFTADMHSASAEHEGVILIFSRNALKRVKNYSDPETGSRFLLLSPGKSLSLSDVIAIIPLSDVDLEDLQSTQSSLQ